MNTYMRYVLVACLLGAAGTSHGAVITIVNGDAPNVGLNDPTPVAAIAGNPGTTLGAQRLNVFQRAADIWGAQLVSSVPIRVRLRFPSDNPDFACATQPGAFVFLGFAGPTENLRDFPNAPTPGTWYPVALRNALVGAVFDPTTEEISAQFNPNMDSTPNCLTGFAGFWYGLDPAVAPPDPPVNPNDPPTQRFALLPMALHEIGHGLGYSTLTNRQTGALRLGFRSIWDEFLLDLEQVRFWDQMTDSQRATSALNDPDLVWSGRNVQRARPEHLRPTLRLRVGANALVGEIRPAAYGSLVPRAGLTAEAVLANDGVGTASDACEPLQNSAQIVGRIAVVDRGNCIFQIKSRHAEAAGAVAVAIANNSTSTLLRPTGTDNSLTIPTIQMAFDLGNVIKSALQSAPATVYTLDFVPGSEERGERGGFARMHAPTPLVAGSSVIHFTNDADGRLLMQPSINPVLFNRLDLSVELLRDIGWTLAPGVGTVVFDDGFEP